jgi:hypothetical protein
MRKTVPQMFIHTIGSNAFWMNLLRFKSIYENDHKFCQTDTFSVYFISIIIKDDQKWYVTIALSVVLNITDMKSLILYI